MTEYQMEQRTKSEAIEALTREVAEGLGDGWSVKTYDPVEYEHGRASDIVHTDGRSFDLHLPDYPHSDVGKVAVSPNWPRTDDSPGSFATASPSNLYNPTETSPSIKVSLSRGVPVLVREIQRRFLPEYTRIWQRLSEKVLADKHWESKRRAVFDEIRAAGGGLLDRPDHTEDHRTRIDAGTYGYGDVRVNGPDSVTIELRSIKPELAITIIRAIRAGAHQAA